MEANIWSQNADVVDMPTLQVSTAGLSSTETITNLVAKRTRAFLPEDRSQR